MATGDCRPRAPARWTYMKRPMQRVMFCFMVRTERLLTSRNEHYWTLARFAILETMQAEAKEPFYLLQ